MRITQFIIEGPKILGGKMRYEVLMQVEGFDDPKELANTKTKENALVVAGAFRRCHKEWNSAPINWRFGSIVQRVG